MLPVRFILLCFIVLLSIPGCTNIPFDSEKWKACKDNEISMQMRWDMADDLINNHKLIGKTLIEIEALLGDAGKNCPKGNCQIYYDLGPCRSGISYGSLTIYFTNSKVEKLVKNCG